MQITLLVNYLLVLAVLYGCSESNVLGDNTSSIAQEKIDSLNEVSFRLRNSDREAAFLAARNALKMSVIEGYIEGVNHAYLNLGILHNNSSMYDSASSYLYRSEYFFRGSNSVEEGLANYYLGRLHSRLQNFENTESYYKRAEEIFEHNEHSELLAFAKNGLGIQHGKQSNFVQALDYFIQASELKSIAGVSNAEELVNISIVYRHQGAYEKALSFAKQALSIAKEKSDSLEIAIEYDNIGDIYNAMALSDSALFHYEQSFSLAKVIGNKGRMAQALNEIASIHRQNGNFNEAISIYKENLQNPVVSISLKEELYGLLSETYFETDQLANAIDYGERSLELARKNGIVKEAINTSSILKESYKKLGNWYKAFEYGELLERYRDTLEMNNQESRFSDLRVALETRDQEKTISVLEKQAEIDELVKQRLYMTIGAVILVLGIVILLIIQAFRNKQKIKDLENKNLKKETEEGKKKLYEKTLHLVHLNNMYGRIEEELKKVNRERVPEIKQILQKINIDKLLDNEWYNFQNYFNSVHESFHDKLHQADIRLTENERRICSLIKVNLTNREIASLLNINEKSVRMSKYRLKKKLRLTEEDDLRGYISALS